MHCAKSVHIRSYSGPHFSRIFPHSDWIRRETKYLSVFSPNAGKCGKNADQNNSEYGHFIHSVDHNPSNMFHKWAALSQISVNPIQGGHIRGCSRMRGRGGGVKRSTPYNLSYISCNDELGRVIPYPKKNQKIHESSDTPLQFCWYQHFFTENHQILLYQETQI